jgi:hypothetical protein
MDALCSKVGATGKGRKEKREKEIITASYIH